jgi:HAD superfamily hydrolase (TIGR01549 family)
VEGVQGICFDAFGTLCRIGERHRPFETLFARIGVDLQDAAKLAMTISAGLTEIAARLGDVRAAEGLAAELDAELANISLFDETAASLMMLREAGVKTWVVSNLAMPYGPPLRRLLGELVGGYSLSFEVGATKPDPAIFAHACSGLSLAPSQVLMVGDSRRADVEGAEAFGMRAVWIRRGRACEWPQSVSSLRELAERRTTACT